MITLELNAKILCELFKGNKPFLIGRNGTIELDCLIYNTLNQVIPNHKLSQLELNAGIFPADSHNTYCKKYMEALENADVMAEGWYEPLKEYEKLILDSANKYRYRIFLRNLEPYYVKPEYRWTQFLANQRVAIINSFATICETQTYMSKAIWGDEAESLLPSSTTWIPIPTYYSPALAQGNAGWPAHIKNFEEAVDDVVKRVMFESCDIAIIGCGGLGMLIGHELKKLGLKCIVMGGATQILFGIKGKRWEKHETISKFFNDAWVVPSDKYKPNNLKVVENGCYW